MAFNLSYVINAIDENKLHAPSPFSLPWLKILPQVLRFFTVTGGFQKKFFGKMFSFMLINRDGGRMIKLRGKIKEGKSQYLEERLFDI